MQFLELKVPPVALFILIAVAMWLVSWSLPFATIDLPARIGISTVFCMVGLLVALMGVFAFRQARTTVDPRVPQKATSLVVRGIYQFSRNPMYLGLLLVLVGWAVFLANYIAIMLSPLFILYMNKFQIAPEEKQMLINFGTQYEAYTDQVRKWI